MQPEILTRVSLAAANLRRVVEAGSTDTQIKLRSNAYGKAVQAAMAEGYLRMGDLAQASGIPYWVYFHQPEKVTR